MQALSCDPYEGMDGNWHKWDCRLASQKSSSNRGKSNFVKRTGRAHISTRSIAHCPSEEVSLQRYEPEGKNHI